ncbi:MAG: hypothetical protein QOI73_525 [Solirubrobacteraceae bacterium]|nr:hypothetical protein [Solirubrobacteraceae bacterium]
MIESLRLQNFRGFIDHTVPFKQTTVLVGANNAGKSTLVEALRIVAVVLDRLRNPHARFVEPPMWLEGKHALIGVSPAVRGLPTDEAARSLFYAYDPPPAVLSATFAGGARVTVFIGPDAQVHGAAWDAAGAEITGRRQAQRLTLDVIGVQPLVAPLLRRELAHQPETIVRGDGTYLAPRHFRNQLRHFDHHAKEFARIAEDTWPGLQIRRRPNKYAAVGEVLDLDIRDEGFVGEVGLMGHGLQMWLQIVWFLARAPDDACVVLDEPDVYMHPDLQRRLLSMVRARFRQLVIATHSVEIISDVDPESIVSVDKRERASTFVTSLPGLQGVMSSIGSLQNIDITRLMSSRSFLLVEGEDLTLLRILQVIAAPTAPPIDLIPHGELGGRGGWGGGVPAKLPTKNAVGESIRCYAILDRDYFPNQEVAERVAEGRPWKVALHVWSRKEIENYLLVPSAIARLIAERARDGTLLPDDATVTKEVDRIVRSMEHDISDAISEVLLARNRKGGPTTANKLTRERMSAAWKTQDGRWNVAPGKKVLSAVSNWAKTHYGVEFNPEQLARALASDEIAQEVKDVLEAISRTKPLMTPR